MGSRWVGWDKWGKQNANDRTGRSVLLGSSASIVKGPRQSPREVPGRRPGEESSRSRLGRACSYPLAELEKVLSVSSGEGANRSRQRRSYLQLMEHTSDASLAPGTVTTPRLAKHAGSEEALS